MRYTVNIQLNNRLYLKDPQESAVGRRIVIQGLDLINKLGFEDFTFKKLAIEIDVTEATVYRYFENKHKLLLYLLSWYWSYLEYKIGYSLQNIKKPEEKLKKIIELLVIPTKNPASEEGLDEIKLNSLVVAEGSKSYLTKQIDMENKDQLFKPYKDLSALFAGIILEYDKSCKFPNSIATTIIETSHTHKFYSMHLPSLSNIKDANEKKLIQFLETLLFSFLKKK